MSVPFYILGLLIRFGPQHGYNLHQMLEEQIADFARIKMPTLYYHLNKLNEQGYIQAKLDQDKNRPEKIIYEITDQGREHFVALSSQIMNSHYQSKFKHDGLLYFFDLIDNDRFFESLNLYRKSLSTRIMFLMQHQKHTTDQVPKNARMLTNAIFKHHIMHMETELNWVDVILQDFEKNKIFCVYTQY